MRIDELRNFLFDSEIDSATGRDARGLTFNNRTDIWAYATAGKMAFESDPDVAECQRLIRDLSLEIDDGQFADAADLEVRTAALRMPYPSCGE